MFPVWQQNGRILPVFLGAGAFWLDAGGLSAIPWTMTKVRHARPGDLAGIIAVQLESWRRTYIDVLPAAYLGEPLRRDLEATWTPRRLDKALVMVADRDGQIVGVACTLPDRPEGPYLDNLHVGRAAQSSGVGRALMAATAMELIGMGYVCFDLKFVV